MSEKKGMIASAAHQGKKRSQQEDRVAHRPDFGVVCDGMGGQNAGGIAAETARSIVIERIDNSRPVTVVEGLAWMGGTLKAANRAVFKAARADPQLHGMGSTVLIGLRIGDVMLLGWLGDSRAYRLRGTKLEQLTTDHSLAQAYVTAGQLTREEAETSRFRHVLYRFAGNGNAPDECGEVVQVDVQPGDRFLLSSDGIDKEMEPSTIAQLLASSDDAAAVCQALIDAANANQGRDNISTVVMLVPGAPVVAVVPQATANTTARTSEPWYGSFVRALRTLCGLGN